MRMKLFLSLGEWITSYSETGATRGRESMPMLSSSVMPPRELSFTRHSVTHLSDREGHGGEPLLFFRGEYRHIARQ